jgi:anhydro-N-acetylmuramic acid kinase
LKPGTQTLVTGGGAKNTYLIEKIQALSDSKIIIPDEKLVDFKEALIFAFLGVLKVRGENNCLSSVTGATKDCSGGIIVEA